MKPLEMKNVKDSPAVLAAVGKRAAAHGGYVLPMDVSRRLGIDAPVVLRHTHREMREEAGVLMTFEAFAPGFGTVTLSKEPCYSYCICFTSKMLVSPDGSLVLNEMNQHCGTGVTDAAQTSVVAARLFNSRGFLRHKKKDYRGAAKDFGTAFAHDRTYGQAAFNLACAKSLLGDKEGAISALEKAIELDAKRFRSKAMKDGDLDSLRSLALFKKLLSQP